MSEKPRTNIYPGNPGVNYFDSWRLLVYVKKEYPQEPDLPVGKPGKVGVGIKSLTAIGGAGPKMHQFRACGLTAGIDLASRRIVK